MRIDTCILVGAGGTGSHLGEPLARLLDYHEHGPSRRNVSHGLLVVDGDRFDENNGARQLGCQPGAYKAMVLADRLKASGVRLPALPIPSYVDRQYFKSEVLGVLPRLTPARSVVTILAVDNHASRREIMAALRDADLPDMLCLAPGNDLAHGQVIAWARIGGEDVLPFPLSEGPEGPLYPELANPADRMPGGCVAQAPSTPQLIVANAMAATVTLAYVHAWLAGEWVASRTEFGSIDRFAIRVRPEGGPRDLVQLAPKAAAVLA